MEELVSKYISSAEQVFSEMKITKTPVHLDVDSVKKIVEYAKAYLEDAKYYRNEKKFEVSLTSIAYCEGLLDVLKLLGAVKFEWSTRKKELRRE